MLNPKDEDAYVDRGMAKNQLDYYQSAIEDYNIAIQINPKSAEAYLHRGVAKLFLRENYNACLDLNYAAQLGDGSAYDMIRKYCH